MKENNGFVKLHRKILQWGWFHDHNTLVVFIYLLLMANFEEHEYRGTKLKPGQLVSGRKRIAEDLGMSEQSVRTALTHLKSTNEITIKTTKLFSIITIVNYEQYQEINQVTNQQSTNNQPTTNHTQEGKKLRNNYSISKEILSESEDSQGDTARDRIIRAWNELPLQNIKTIGKGSTRYTLLQARTKEYGLGAILEAITIIGRSPFLLGQNKRGWTITFDWFIKPNNFPKVLEGNYLDKDSSGNEVNRMTDEEFAALAAAHEGADEW